MIAAVESAVARAPASRWTESALFLAGNYYWVQLDRDRAASYYKRLSDNFPSAAEALPAQWRVTWAAVLKREPDAAADLAEHLRRFPGSQFSPDALYWLGRLSEESENSALARSYYEKLQERFPQNYFATTAAKRLRALGPGPESDADMLATIPPVPPGNDAGRHDSCRRRESSDARRCTALDRFRRFRGTRIARRLRRYRRAAPAARSRSGSAERRPRRRGDRHHPPDLSAARMAAVRRSSARSVAHGLRDAVPIFHPVALHHSRAWIPCSPPD